MRKRTSDCLGEFCDVLRNEVGQVHVLRPSPDLFIGIEFRGVRRQPFEAQPAWEPCQELVRGRTVDLPAIQDQDDPPGKVSEDFRHETLDIRGTEIVLLERRSTGPDGDAAAKP